MMFLFSGILYHIITCYGVNCHFWFCAFRADKVACPVQAAVRDNGGEYLPDFYP